MADTPDVGKIIGLIMENPDLIARISALARGEGGEEGEKTPPADSPPTNVESESAEVSLTPETAPARVNRQRLLSAMKPYLSEERCRAIDAMSAVGEILSAMKRR